MSNDDPYFEEDVSDIPEGSSSPRTIKCLSLFRRLRNSNSPPPVPEGMGEATWADIVQSMVIQISGRRKGVQPTRILTFVLAATEDMASETSMLSLPGRHSRLRHLFDIAIAKAVDWL